MNSHFHRFAAAAAIAAGAAFHSSPAAAAAPVRICTFPGSPSVALDKLVASETFKTARIDVQFVEHGIAGRDDDDGVSLKTLRRTLGHGCDVIAGFPRSPVADASANSMLFSQSYLDASYVSVEASNEQPQRAENDVVAATYGSPSQLIAVQQQHASFDLENTPELTVEAVANRRAIRAIVWYPAVVAYERAHMGRHFDVHKTHSPYSDWQLVFVVAPNATALRQKIDRALSAMRADGRLAALTRAWALPTAMQPAQAEAKPTAVTHFKGELAAAGRDIVRPGAYSREQSAQIIKISATTASASVAPSFDRSQVVRGKSLYASHCAKCHGANLQGITAPALSGPAFAPASGAHLTIGGVYNYMATNMPADRPGKLKDDEYAAIMAFLLNANGYAPSSAKMTAESARSSTTMLNAGPLSAIHVGTSTASAK